MRWLSFLRPESGTFITDTQQIVPPFAFRDRRRGAMPSYISATVDDIARLVPNSVAVDATGMAESMGNTRVANTVLLGILSASLHFPAEAWEPVLKEAAPKGTAQLNIEAFARGRALGLAPPPAPEIPLVDPSAMAAGAPPVIMGGNGAPAGAAATATAAPMPPPQVELEITDPWCKACDICVKMCPERCLVLNRWGSVSLTDPALCTGCRLCEMLCPDFAIRVSA